MTIFLAIYVFVLVVCIYLTHNKILCNDVFMLCLFWALILGVYFFSGVSYGNYFFSVELFFFLGLCAIAFSAGRRTGYNSKTKVFSQSKQLSKIKLFWFTLIGILGAFIYIYDLIRLNGLMSLLIRDSGMKNDLEISVIGTIGSLLIPVMLVTGLYIIAFQMKYKRKFSIIGILLVMGYTIPCILRSGRESILYVAICFTVIITYCSFFKKKSNSNTIKKLLIRTTIVLCAIFLTVLMLNITRERFGEAQINSFLLYNDVPSNVISEASKWGEFDFLYYNLISYFSHQISFLDFILKEYNGPYMFGFYELNILSRRMPDSFGLDYTLVRDQINRMYIHHHVDFGNGWNTVLGSFIIDFGKIGAVFFCFICGYISGKIRKKFVKTMDVRYAVLTSLVCMSAFSTIQLGPFYQMLILGTFIWWYVIFKREENVTLI